MKPKQAKAQVRIGRLTSVWRVSIEVARVYRAARRGDIEDIKAYRLATVLATLAKCLETSDLEKRLEELENTVASASSQPFKPKLVS